MLITAKRAIIGSDIMGNLAARTIFAEAVFCAAVGQLGYALIGLVVFVRLPPIAT
jgi:hypothetical protein